MSEPLLVRAWLTLRDEGLRSFWFKSLAAVGYSRFYVLRRPLSEPIPECSASLPITIEWLLPGDADAYRAFRESPREDDVAGRLRAGDRCLVARHDGRIIGALWSSTTGARAKFLGRDLPLAAGEAYQFDAYTAPSARGMGIAPALSVAWLRRLRNEGCSATVRLTSPENVAALRAHAKVGYRVTGLVHWLRLGRWRYDFADRPAAHPAAGFTPAARRSTSRSSS